MAMQVETQTQSQIQGSPGATAGLETLVSGYRPLPGVFDEMMDADGQVRTHWQPVLAMLAALGPDELNRRFALPTACLVLALVGIPLGLSSKKSGKSGGFVLTILGFVYFRRVESGFADVI